MNMDLLLSLIAVVKEAGKGIMDVYDSGSLGVEFKHDNSPLTRADMLAHDLITGHLSEVTPDIPIISEEGAQYDYDARSSWKCFYLVDPLDGTKSFIRRSGEFTVNVGLIQEGVPVMGIIYSPLSDVLYYALHGEGAYRKNGSDEPVRINVATKADMNGLVAVTSRSHGHGEREAFGATGMVGEFIPSGSSLKFCFVAEGKAHIYPRFGPLWEWDTAAGHAILMEAGGRVVDLMSFGEIEYNKRDMLHSGFLALPGWMLEDIVPYLSGMKTREG